VSKTGPCLTGRVNHTVTVSTRARGGARAPPPISVWLFLFGFIAGGERGRVAPGWAARPSEERGSVGTYEMVNAPTPSSASYPAAKTKTENPPPPRSAARATFAARSAPRRAREESRERERELVNPGLPRQNPQPSRRGSQAAPHLRCSQRDPAAWPAPGLDAGETRRWSLAYSAAVFAVRPCAIAEHSAITAEERAIGLVK
jgi:hypothetical protein